MELSQYLVVVNIIKIYEAQASETQRSACVWHMGGLVTSPAFTTQA